MAITLQKFCLNKALRFLEELDCMSVDSFIIASSFEEKFPNLKSLNFKNISFNDDMESILAKPTSLEFTSLCEYTWAIMTYQGSLQIVSISEGFN